MSLVMTSGRTVGLARGGIDDVERHAGAAELAQEFADLLVAIRPVGLERNDPFFAKGLLHGLAVR